MKILYFTSDFSAQNIEFAKKHGMTMRNAAIVETAQNLEQCDFVYGDETPENYRQVFAWFVLPENNAAQGVSQETHNAVLAENAQLKAENERLKTELARHESSAHLSELALKRQDEQIVQLTERIAELEAELATAKANNPKGKKTTPAE